MLDFDKEQRTEEATSKQRQKFRDRGDVAKSRDIASFIALAAGTASIVAAWPVISSHIIGFTSGILGHLDSRGKGAIVGVNTISTLLWIIAPVSITVLVLGIVGQVLQVGWNPTTEPIQISFAKINPLPRFRQLFVSVATLIELLKTFVIICVIGFVVVSVLKEELMDNGRLVGLLPQEVLRRLGHMAIRIVVSVGIVYAFIAITDLLIERYRHKRKMRMTKEEVKQERKDREGDPVTRNRVRRKQREVSRRRMLNAVKQADVVVVNPTHYSVALRYKLDVDIAPVILAIGVDILAAKIREQARRYSVPVVSDPKLARALYAKGKVGAYIPADLYKAVASLLVWVYRATGKVAS